MALVEEGKVKIESLNPKGLGVGKTSIAKIQLPYTLPGEVAEFERHEYRRKSNSILKNIIQKSSERIKAECEYFEQCGGCLLQHLDKNTYDNFKMNVVKEALISSNIDTQINPLLIIPKSRRRRANLEFVKKEDKSLFGFHKFHFNHIVDIDHCYSMLPEMSWLLKPLKNLLNEVLEIRQKANLYITYASNGIDILIRLHNEAKFTNEQAKLCEDFSKKYSLIRFILRYRKQNIYSYEKEVPYILFDNIPVEIDSDSFLQATPDSDKILSDLVLKYLELNDKDIVADLFCGRGTYSLPVSKSNIVHGFESDKHAIMALEKASIQADRKIILIQRDLYSAPLYPHELKKFHKIIINPPRAGASAQTTELANSEIEKICYISCNPETFARDTKILIKQGYKLLEVTPVDQFFWNPHVEVVGIFQRY